MCSQQSRALFLIFTITNSSPKKNAPRPKDNLFFLTLKDSPVECQYCVYIVIGFRSSTMIYTLILTNDYMGKGDIYYLRDKKMHEITLTLIFMSHLNLLFVKISMNRLLLSLLPSPLSRRVDLLKLYDYF